MGEHTCIAEQYRGWWNQTRSASCGYTELFPLMITETAQKTQGTGKRKGQVAHFHETLFLFPRVNPSGTARGGPRRRRNQSTSDQLGILRWPTTNRRCRYDPCKGNISPHLGTSPSRVRITRSAVRWRREPERRTALRRTRNSGNVTLGCWSQTPGNAMCLRWRKTRRRSGGFRENWNRHRGRSVLAHLADKIPMRRTRWSWALL